MDRIGSIRRQCALEMGVVVHPIRIRDNFQLGSNEYVIKLRGIDIARGTVRPGYYMAMDSGMVEEKIEVIETTEPAFGLPAVWIRGKEKEQAELAGYTVVEATAVLATHLMEALRFQADRVLGRNDVQNLIDTLREEYPTVVDSVIPNVVRMSRMTVSKSAPGRSILLTKKSAGTRYRTAWRQTTSVCGSTPPTAHRTTTAPSKTRRDRSTSAVKSTCPGVSTMLIWWSRQWQVMAAEVIVIPLSRSCSIQSIVALPSSTSPI